MIYSQSTMHSLEGADIKSTVDEELDVLFCRLSFSARAYYSSDPAHTTKEYRQNHGSIHAAVAAFKKNELALVEFWVRQFYSGNTMREVLGCDFLPRLRRVMSRYDHDLSSYIDRHLSSWPAKPNKTTLGMVERLRQEFDASRKRVA